MKKKTIIYIVITALVVIFGAADAIIFSCTGHVSDIAGDFKIIFIFMLLTIIWIDSEHGFDSEEES